MGDGSLWETKKTAQVFTFLLESTISVARKQPRLRALNEEGASENSTENRRMSVDAANAYPELGGDDENVPPLREADVRVGRKLTAKGGLRRLNPECLCTDV